MTQEEKAKAYDKAIEKAKELHLKFIGMNVGNTLEDIFPQLKESEDERIRKALINGFKDYNDLYGEWNYGITPNEAIAWLEKQGEHADKVEPKFKVGDFIKHDKANIICKVISVNSGSYYVENIETSGRIELFNAEQNFHLWTIQDAKEGDVLEYEGEIFILKELKKKVIASRTIEYYCCYDGEHFICNSIYSLMQEDLANVHLSDKEQRDLLFQKMKESGYEWDAEKKDLKKIEQQSAWSEEDENLINYILTNCMYYAEQTGYVKEKQNHYIHQKAKEWLRSLQLKSEWSEEDEKILKSVIATCELCCQDRDSSPARHLLEMQTKWLKSLKPQSHWKPSDEQTVAIKFILDEYKMDGELKAKLEILYNDLEKLKG